MIEVLKIMFFPPCGTNESNQHCGCSMLKWYPGSDIHSKTSQHSNRKGFEFSKSEKAAAAFVVNLHVSQICCHKPED